MNDVLNDGITVTEETVVNDETTEDPTTENNEMQGEADTVEEPKHEDEDISAEELKKTVAALQVELEAYKAAAAQQEAIAKQLNEFSELFPDIAVRSIPDQVWEDVKQGNTLAAAYSIYEKRVTEAARRIELINAKNAQKSAGAVGKNMTQEFFSADDVRKMSPSEVRANYTKIRRSMEKWN